MLLESHKLFVILRSRPSLPGEGHWSLTQATRMATFGPVWQTGVLSHLLNLISALIQTFITTSIYNFHISFKYSSRKRCKELELGAIRRVLIWFLPTGEFQRRKKTSVEAWNANCSACTESWHKLGVNLFKAHDIVMNSGFAWLWGRNCIYQVAVGNNIQLLILASAIVDGAHAASSFTLWKQQLSSSGVGSNPCRTVLWKEGKKERRKEIHYVDETASLQCGAHCVCSIRWITNSEEERLSHLNFIAT